MHLLWNQLERAARLRASAPAIHCADERLSWAEALQRSARCAAALQSLGVGCGSRFAFISPNSIPYMLMPFAADRLGATFVPLNSRLSCAELVEQLRDADPVVVIAAEPFVSLAREAAARAEVPLAILGSGSQGDEPRFDLLASDAGLPDLAEGAEQPLLAIYYTGGTTGRAKGVMLTADRLMMNGLQWAYCVQADEDEHLLIAAPMFHMVAALNAIIGAVLGCKLTILDRFTPSLALDAIETNRITNVPLVPAMLDMLLADASFADRDLSSLRTITYGGSPISQPSLASALEALPGVRLYQVYGQTEGGPTISILPPRWHSAAPDNAHRLRSAGKPLPLTDLRIARPDGTECARGETGEITVRGPAVSPGYWNRPDENAAVFRGGWLHTGDAGYLDDEGLLYIVDRIKDMIVSGGENVYAAEVERVLVQHPAVRECAVIGVPSERWGETVHAIVLSHSGKPVDEPDLIAFCRDRLAHFKAPRSVEFLSDSFPLTGAGKVDKKALRARHAMTG